MENKVHPHQEQINPPVYTVTDQGPSQYQQMFPGQSGQPPPQAYQMHGAAQYPPPQQAWGASPPGQYPPGPPGQPMAPYYPMCYPPGAVQPPPPPQQQQQQQQQVVVINSNPVCEPVHIHQAQSFCGHMTLACFVFWCCSPLFGLVAFILAAVASNISVSDQNQARQLGKASYGVSIAGIVITVVVVAIVVGVVVGAGASYYDSANSVVSSYSSCSGYTYSYNYKCYNYKTYTYYSYSCSALSGAYDSATGYCYYNY